MRVKRLLGKYVKLETVTGKEAERDGGVVDRDEIKPKAKDLPGGGGDVLLAPGGTVDRDE